MNKAQSPRPKAQGPTAIAIAAACVCLAAASLIAQGRGGAQPPAQGRGAQAPQTARAIAPIDLTGYWTAVISEDWHTRMLTAPRNDFGSGIAGTIENPGVGFIGAGPNPAAQGNIPYRAAAAKLAASWDPAKDEAAGEQCRAYGAAGLMRLPTRVRIAWQDDSVLKLETDAGTQTRLLRFGMPQGEGGDWQGISTASWDYPQTPMAGRGFGRPPGGSLKVVTSRMKPGYLRRNGVPYSANAVMTEYIDRFDVPGGDPLLVVTAEIVDPEYLATPYWTSIQFKRDGDASKWHPTPCKAR